MKKLFLLSFLALIISSCSDTSKSVIYSTPADYQPLKIRAWYIYDVDSITYNDFTTPVTVDTIQFQLKEEITDTFTDQAGRLNFRLERSKRFYNDSLAYDSLNWKVSDIWFITQNGSNIERVEENNRYISLLNPVKDQTVWDGNAFNFNDTWDYTYLKVSEPFDTYGNTVTVNQIFEDNLIIIYQLYEEVYAKDIGLVNRIRINVESQDLSDPSIPVLNRIEKGNQYFQKLNDYYIP
jgi:hypothetical protein